MKTIRLKKLTRIFHAALCALSFLGVPATSWAVDQSPLLQLDVEDGRSVTLYFTPERAYRIADVRIDGQSVGAVDSYTLADVRRNTAVDVEFAPLAEALLPVVASPVSGGTVTSLTPVLTVYNPLVAEVITYEFQVATDPEFQQLVSSAVAVSQGVTLTPWTVTDALADEARYYWRARTAKGDIVSPWTAVCTFTVQTSGAATTSSIDLSEYLVAGSPGVFEVTDAQSETQGVVVNVPANSLDFDALLIVSTVKNAPAATPGFRALGKVYEFGPHGVPFAEPVTLMIPYTQADLQRAGMSDASRLTVATYNSKTLAWERVPVTAVDYKGMRLVCEVSHFSMYAVAASDEPPTTTDGGSTPAPATNSDSSGGGGGGGGCFIAATATEDMPGGQPLFWLISVLLLVALVEGSVRVRSR